MDSKYSTILFDFDGTLTSSLELWVRSFQYAFSKFEIIVDDDVIIKRCFYRSFEDVVSEFNLPCNIEFGQFVYEGLDIYFDQATLYRGVKEILLDCANQNIKLAVVTSSPRVIVERTLANLNIASFFSTLITADEVENFKPHPEPILRALKYLGSKDRDSLVIGDSTVDVLAARAARISAGLFFPDAHLKFYDFQKLVEIEPHFVFRHYDELHQHIFNLKRDIGLP